MSALHENNIIKEGDDLLVTFSYEFDDDRNCIELKIRDDCFLVLKRINSFKAELYFRNESNDRIHIPNGTLVHLFDTNISIPKDSKKCFDLLHSQDYTVSVDGIHIFSLKRRCDWVLDKPFTTVVDF